MMTMRKLRDYLEAQPFRPLVIRTVSGSRHEVLRPDYLFVPPVGDTFLVVEQDGAMHHIGISHVGAVETPRKNRKS